MIRLGLIGFPLSHSFSKKYFTEKFEKERINAVFENYSMETLDSLPEIVTSEKLDGFAITIPHKKNILPLLYRQSAEVAEMNACNCVVVKEEKWFGYNTDVTGFERSIQPLIQPVHRKALILGTGGAASAVQFVLRRLGISYKLVSRSPGEDRLTYTELDTSMMNEYKLIINCTPTGTFPDLMQAPDLPYQSLDNNHFLYDLIYNPPETLFLQYGREAGATIKNGYEMLVLQAEQNWRIWNSLPA